MTRHRRSPLSLLVLAGATALPPVAAPPPEPPRGAEATRAAVRAFAAEHGFHGTVLVRWSDGRRLQESFGLAERAFGVPVSDGTRFWIASITKTFTAVLVLKLYEESRLDLDATISAYLPDYAGEGADRVSIHHLLNHTSGIAHWEPAASYEEAARKGMPIYQLPHSTDALLAEYASGPLVSEVGTTFAYSNADYAILGKIVERLTGQRYEQALRERILAPLGLADTGLLRQRTIVPRLARTYFQVPETGELVNDLPVYPENWYAAGGMYSTARDLARFAEALYRGSLLRPATLERMLTPGLDGYGYSVWLWDFEAGGRRHRTAERFGSIMGANAALLHLLDEGTTVVILSNTSSTDMRSFAVHVAAASLER